MTKALRREMKILDSSPVAVENVKRVVENLGAFEFQGKRIVRLPLVPSKPVAPTKCKCTPATCGCKQKRVDKPR